MRYYDSNVPFGSFIYGWRKYSWQNKNANPHNPLILQIENAYFTYDPHAFVIVYSVDDQKSFLKAEEMLSYLKRMQDSSMQQQSNGRVCSDKAVILVANKVDLQRSRIVSAKGIP